MSNLPFYSPGCWVDQGLLLPMVRKTIEAVAVLKSRSGNWSVRRPVFALTASFMMSGLCFTAQAAVVADLEMSAPKPAQAIRLAPDEHRVPDGYWDRLSNAAKSVERLPAQDLSKDPVVMV